jgi:type IV pilus assembly protein PilY1
MKNFAKKCAFFVLSVVGINLYAASTDISTLPLNTLATVAPNLIFILDDSDSLDSEVSMNTYAGWLWWNGKTNSFNDASGQALSPANFVPGVDSGGTPWFTYLYLFPNGVTSGARRVGDDYYYFYGYYAVPPIPAYAYLRSSEYNPLYYNPNVTYKPWPPAYISGNSVTFANQNPTQAISNPTIATSPKINLTTNQSTTNTNYTFRMAQGMVIPGSSMPGIQIKKLGTPNWISLNNNFTVPNNQAYDANIPYYPATYYVLDQSCASGPPVCVTAPDGKNLRRYEIKNGNTFPSGRTYTAEMQNFANWYSYYRKRKHMLASAMGAVLPETANIRVGITTLNNVPSSISMNDLNSTNPSTNVQSVLGVFDTNKSTGPAPTNFVLNFVGQQYMNNKNIIQAACQTNTVMYVTDGYPNAPPYVPGVTLPAYSRSVFGGTTPYMTTYNNTIADIALYYYTTNLRPDLPVGLVPTNPSNTSVNADKNVNLHMNTYTLSLTAQGTIYGTGTPQALDPFANPPTWPSLAAYKDGAPAILDDMWHASINSRATMYNAQNFMNVASNLQTAISDILLQSAASSALGVANPNITASRNQAFAASYLGSTGDILPYVVDINIGTITPANTWSAQALLDNQSPASRLIATYNGSIGVPFLWGSLTASMQTALNSTIPGPPSNDGSYVLNWVRGEKTYEGTYYRKRTHILGDLVNASPVIVAGSNFNYSDLGYSAFFTSIANRPETIYQGSNDGMLHAFDANTGAERWAYIPNLVVNNLKTLASKVYNHLFFVDATPTIGDVAINNGTSWRTLLVGGLNAGGNGYYALDITDPVASSSANLASKVLWEFPNASTPTAVANNVGLSYGKPIIAKTRAYGWVVLVTSGYNNVNGDGRGHLFVLNPDTGALIKDIATTSGSPGSPSGLAQIAAFASHWNYDATIDYVYGGDLNGNVWRFDLSSSNINSWNVSLLASLVDSNNIPQPITSIPQLSRSGSYRLVYIGTGQLLGKTDLSTSQTQTMYALVDNLSASPTILNVRNNLFRQTVSGTNISNTVVNFAVNPGWYFDFPSSGERLTTDPQLIFGVLVFNTSIPSASGCTVQSYKYAVDQATGGTLRASIFGNTTPWARISLSADYVSNPTIIVLPNKKVISIVHNSDNTFSNVVIPSTISTPQSKQVGWKEVIIQ